MSKRASVAPGAVEPAEGKYEELKYNLMGKPTDSRGRQKGILPGIAAG
jgi:hypothetical protein